jgi:hypothetical protein
METRISSHDVKNLGIEEGRLPEKIKEEIIPVDTEEVFDETPILEEEREIPLDKILEKEAKEKEIIEESKEKKVVEKTVKSKKEVVKKAVIKEPKKTKVKGNGKN